jgi:hypothetical protein
MVELTVDGVNDEMIELTVGGVPTKWLNWPLMVFRRNG